MIKIYEGSTNVYADLIALGQHVQIVVKPARKGKSGTLSVAA